MNRTSMLIIFITTVLVVYSLANIYIFYKGYNALPVLRLHKIAYSIIFFLLAFTFVAAKIIESRHSSVVTDALNIIGGFWMAFLLYGFIFFFISDILLLILKIPGFISGEEVFTYRKWSFYIISALTAILITSGFINALIPNVKEYNISINKSAGNLKNYRIAAVSDIHLGSVIRKRSIKKLAFLLKKIEPDVIFLLGDIVDGEIGPVLRGDLLKYFDYHIENTQLYAITGNHEFIGGASRTIPYIESKGIKILKDEIITLDGGIQVIGRIDKDSRTFFKKDRKELSEIMKGIDSNRPIIVLDHQPYKLDEVAGFNVDLQLSGHTHNGQMWPLNYITKAIFELSYGYLKKGNTQFIVSSGYGLWGPRVRLGSRSEVLLINITFTGSDSKI